MRAFADVQALVFDVFGTVVDWRGGVARESAAFLARYAPGADPAAFAEVWRRRYSPAMEQVRSGRRPFAPLYQRVRREAQVIPAMGCSGLLKCGSKTSPIFETRDYNLRQVSLLPKGGPRCVRS
jgi:hypothetical protein